MLCTGAPGLDLDRVVSTREAQGGRPSRGANRDPRTVVDLRARVTWSEAERADGADRIGGGDGSEAAGRHGARLSAPGTHGGGEHSALSTAYPLPAMSTHYERLSFLDNTFLVMEGSTNPKHVGAT